MSEAKFYAGIGSRSTPPEILAKMRELGARAAAKGWILRSGGAIGADRAFESGARSVGGSQLQIFFADDATDEAIALAAQHHPNWGACSEYAKKLHGRNSQIILGQSLDQPVQFVLYWTPAGKTGGTGQALRLCKALGIKTIPVTLES